MSELEQAKADLEKARVELERQFAAYLKILPTAQKEIRKAVVLDWPSGVFLRARGRANPQTKTLVHGPHN
jgi:hypothetical protein